MMKRIINLVIISALTGCFMLLLSCGEDWLIEEPPGAAAGTIIQNEKGIEALLIGAYDNITGNHVWNAMATEWVYGSVASDDAYKGTHAGLDDFNAIERYETSPMNTFLARRWSDGYDGVSRTNDVLQFLWITQEGPNAIPEPRATQIEAEAKFLRAWFHFKTTRIFRYIPYIKTIEEMDGMTPPEVPNDSEGWDDIKADLQFAIDNLPESKPLGHVGRACRWSAKAVMAHVHLYLNELAQARPLLDDIINNGGFKLANNYYDNYQASTNNNEESIFEIQISVTGETAGNTLMLSVPTAHQRGPAARGWGQHQPSQNLFEAFQVTDDGLPVLDKNDRVELAHDQGIASTEEFIPTDHFLDPRVDWTISRRGIDFLGWGICEGMAWIREQPHGGPYMTKKYFHWKDNDAIAVGARNNRNFRAYRLSHVLLWRAEIAVEDGDFEYARQLVNQIRERAKNSDVYMGRVSTYVFDGGPVVVDWDQPAANYSIEPYTAGHEAFANQANARKAVRMEHRLEFATEGKRFFQLRRWGIAEKVLNDYLAEDSEFRVAMHGARFNPPKDEYWPIPQFQLDIQPILKQDPNY